MLTKIVAKTFLFNKKGEVLVLTRSSDDLVRPGEHDIPGGSIEPDESFTDGAVREIREETGILVEFSMMQLVQSETESKQDIELEKQVNLIRLIYVGTTEQTTVTLSHEHQAYAWQTLDEVIEHFGYKRYQRFASYIKEHNLAPV